MINLKLKQGVLMCVVAGGVIFSATAFAQPPTQVDVGAAKLAPTGVSNPADAQKTHREVKSHLNASPACSSSGSYMSVEAVTH